MYPPQVLSGPAVCHVAVGSRTANTWCAVVVAVCVDAGSRARMQGTLFELGWAFASGLCRLEGVCVCVCVWFGGRRETGRETKELGNKAVSQSVEGGELWAG